MKALRTAEELEDARASWQGEFQLIPSVTDSEAAIIVAHGVTNALLAAYVLIGPHWRLW